MGKIAIALDIETRVIQPSDDEINDLYLERLGSLEEYTAPSNFKDPVKIEEHRQKWLSKRESEVVELEKTIRQELIDKRKFTLVGAEPICVGLGIVDGFKVHNLEAKCSDDIAELGAFFCDYTASCGDVRLIGWNLDSFDLPILLKAVAKHGKGMRQRIGKWGTVDLLNRPFARKGKLKEVGAAFGLTPLVPDVDGSQVEDLYREKKFTEIEEYCKSDVDLTGRLFGIASLMFEF